MKCSFIIYLLFFFSSQIFAQPIKNIIVDQQGKAIPFASVGIIGTSLGTVANAKGEFIINNYTKNSRIKFSSIGYKSSEYSVLEIIKLDGIILETEISIFKDIIIMPDSSLKEILKKSYLNITKNYPVVPFTMGGYYSELESSKDGIIVYAGESIIEIHQEGYHKENDIGQVKVINARVSSNLKKDTLDNVLWQGGPFIGVMNDIVKKRVDFIDYKNFNKNFRYELVEENYYEADTIYVIQFTSLKHAKKSGKIYIDKKTGAYIKFKWIDEPNDNSFIKTIRKTAEKSEINFKKIENLWVLSNMDFELEFKNRKTKQDLKIKIIFVVTSTDLNSKPIAYNERNLNGVFSILDDKNPEIFNGYPTYIESFTSDSVEVNFRNVFDKNISDNYNTNYKKSVKAIIVENLMKLSFNFGLGHTTLSNSPVVENSDNNDFIVDFVQRDGLFLNSGILFKINRFNAIFYEVKNIVFQKTIEGKQLNLGYIRSYNIKRKGNPMFFQPNIAVSKVKESGNLGDFSDKKNNPLHNPTTLQSPKLDYTKLGYQINFGLGFEIKTKKSSISIRPQIGKIINEKIALIYNENTANSPSVTYSLNNKNRAINYSLAFILNLSN
jgi:hypothetical protein